MSKPLSFSLPHDPYVGQREGNLVYTARGVWECRGCGADSCDMPGWFSPIAIGPNPAQQLQVWNQTTAAWSVASATVVVGPEPGTPIPVGQLWQDATGWLRAWQGQVWLDICMPVPGAVQPAAGTYPVVVSLTQPGAPVTPSLWLDPSGPRLDLFSAAVWSHLGIRPARLVRTLIPPGTAQQAAPWAAGAQAGSFIHVAMQRGIDPATGNQLDPTLVTPNGLNRVQQAFCRRWPRPRTSSSPTSSLWRSTWSPISR